MKNMDKKIGTSILLVGLIAISTFISLPDRQNTANAAQGCALNSFYGTVTYNGVATNNATVTLMDLTNGAPALTATTSSGGLYLIESANLATCAVAGDQIQLTATFNAVSASTTVAYAAQAQTLVDLAIVFTPAITSITVAPPSVGLTVGGPTQQLTAMAFDQLSAPLATQPAFEWVSNNTAVATVDVNGMVTPVAAGTANVTASSSGIISTPSTPVTVSAATTTFTLSYSAGAGGTLTGSTTQVVNAGGSGTAVTAVPSLGFSFVDWSDAITANPRTDTNVQADITVTANFTPIPPVLTSVSISPLNPSVILGTPQTFTATAFDQFGIIFPAAVTFSSGNTAVATIDSVTGLATTLAVGTTTITATSGTVATSTILTVTPVPVLATINISPVSPSVIVGTPQTFTATTLDQFGAPIAATVAWSSASTTVANIDPVTGIASTTAVGTTTITATSGAVSTSTLLTVTPVPVLTTINISPIAPAIAVGATQQFTAVTLDQFGAPITATVTWSSASTTIASIDPVTGLATSSALGATAITASSGAVSSSTILTIAPTYTLTYSSGANGSVAGSLSQTVLAGGSGTAVTAVPNSNFLFINWSDGSTANPRTDTNIQANLAVSANFGQISGGGVPLGLLQAISNNLRGIPVTYPSTIIITPPGQIQQVLGVRIYGIGALIRGSNKAIYLITSNGLVKIHNLVELRKYRGQKIYDISDDDLAQYLAGLILPYGDGDLIRGRNGKIYVITNGTIMHVRSLTELRENYAGKKITDVNDDVINKFVQS